ncbi:SDR family oxidoreductase [Mucilaginibacter auburnensis]|uniref:Short-subunit dehydrogenase n=1 Tax=Mucilaginibacter auburnensis TaxID=1457233 RepID=A0A2H9VTS2_9SPHI|nr:SDR family oxidoreductase [Mucilaginibacter auburnensis]PJJ84215.1 short-subunit dehydrogenase [Mucilaginibacter auburnensis]
MKKALITGANKSIGFETARQLLQKEYYVYLGARDITKGNEAVAQLKSEGFDNVELLQIDVSDPSSVAEAGKKITELDVLINNAGILGGWEQSAQTASLDVIKEVFNTNFFGAINVAQTFLDALKKSDEPRIVNVTSGLGSLTLHSDPNWKYYQVKNAAYGPSKSALNAYTIVLAYELKDTNFKINAVDPGYTQTDFNHHNGPGKVEDAAAIVVKYATIGNDGPTGKFFSKDMDGDSEESPW